MQLIFARIIFLLGVSFMFTSVVHASGGGHGDEKPKEEKKDAHADPHGGGGHEEAAPPAPVGPQRKYNPGTVTMFPAEITGTDLITGEKFSLKTKEGRVTLVFFIASWSDPCQQVITEIKAVANRYSSIYTDVVYVFAHDTKDDAKGFAKEHKIVGRMTLATNDILKNFKNPQIPAAYVSDRKLYLGNRFLKMTSKELSELDKYLMKVTAL